MELTNCYNYFFVYPKQIEIQKNLTEKINKFFYRYGELAGMDWMDNSFFKKIFIEKRMAFSASANPLQNTIRIGAYKVAEFTCSYLQEKEKCAHDLSAFIGNHTWLKLNALLGFFLIGKGLAATAALTARAASFVALSIVAISFTLIVVMTSPFWIPAYAYSQQIRKIQPKQKIIETQQDELSASSNAPSCLIPLEDLQNYLLSEELSRELPFRFEVITMNLCKKVQTLDNLRSQVQNVV